jgi:hypothetical protein
VASGAAGSAGAASSVTAGAAGWQAANMKAAISKTDRTASNFLLIFFSFLKRLTNHKPAFLKSLNQQLLD